jgi:hypothetical protein
MAEVTADDESITAEFEGRGFARCNDMDVYSAKTGRIISLGRAIQDFGRRVEESGHARSVTKDELDRVMNFLASDIEEALSELAETMLS